jgi:hypothetical protein
MKIYKCDRCLKIKDIKDLIHIVGYPMLKEKKSGYKAKLRADICMDCFSDTFKGVR